MEQEPSPLPSRKVIRPDPNLVSELLNFSDDDSLPGEELSDKEDTPAITNIDLQNDRVSHHEIKEGEENNSKDWHKQCKFTFLMFDHETNKNNYISYFFAVADGGESNYFKVTKNTKCTVFFV